MKIGFCTTDPAVIRRAYEAGFAYVEVSNWSVFRMDEARFATLLALKEELPAGYLYACNGLVPTDMRLTGPDVNFESIRAFSQQSFARLAQLGVKMIVFGSSAAKTVPEGFSFDKALEQLVSVTRIFAEAAATNGQRVCIEPLRYAECNIINTAKDAVDLALRADRPNVGGHVDYYHLMQNGEKMSSLTGLAKHIIHTHIASPCLRSAPTPDDGADYKSFFDALRAGGYDETVTFEGGCDKTPQTLQAMCEYLTSL